MAAYQIDCINKDDRRNIYERILAVGGPENGSGQRWHVSLDDAIDGMKNKGWTFYVVRGGVRVEVERAEGPSGKEYLRTKPDSTGANNLLSLPECR